MEAPVTMSATAQQYYALSKQWQADLEFFKIETAFFHRLIDEHFAQLISQEYLPKLKDAGHKIYELERDESELNKLLTAHLRQLYDIAENHTGENIEELSLKHNAVEKMEARLTKEYRDLKAELFALVEKAMTEKKLISNP